MPTKLLFSITYIDILKIYKKLVINKKKKKKKSELGQDL